MNLKPETPSQAQALKSYNNYDALANYAPAIYLQFTSKVSEQDPNFKNNFITAVKKAPHAALEYAQGHSLFTSRLKAICKSLTSPV